MSHNRCSGGNTGNSRASVSVVQTPRITRLLLYLGTFCHPLITTAPGLKQHPLSRHRLITTETRHLPLGYPCCPGATTCLDGYWKTIKLTQKKNNLIKNYLPPTTLSLTSMTVYLSHWHLHLWMSSDRSHRNLFCLVFLCLWWRALFWLGFIIINKIISYHHIQWVS